MDATTTTTDTEIRIDRVLGAPIERVYDAWTRPELLSRWYCPNPDLELTVDADVRVGGRYVVKMGPHVVRGAYTELDPPHVVAFTWRWDEFGDRDTQVRVELSEADGGTRLVLLHTGLRDAQSVANHLEGWEGCLRRLPAVLTS